MLNVMRLVRRDILTHKQKQMRDFVRKIKIGNTCTPWVLSQAKWSIPPKYNGKTAHIFKAKNNQKCFCHFSAIIIAFMESFWNINTSRELINSLSFMLIWIGNEILILC